MLYLFQNEKLFQYMKIFIFVSNSDYYHKSNNTCNMSTAGVHIVNIPADNVSNNNPRDKIKPAFK